MKRALTIAGSDSSGGAGIQADLKTFQAFGVYGLSVITGVTAQDSRRVHGIDVTEPEFVALQFEAVLSDTGVDGAKTGMLCNAELVMAVSEKLKESGIPLLVVDPVMASSSGDTLLEMEALDMVMEKLLPLATLVTPNIPEAETISGDRIGSVEDMKRAAFRIRETGCKAVLIKGGHLEGDPVDMLFDGERFVTFTGKRVIQGRIHGTGCTLSAAILAALLRGKTLENAVRMAKTYVAEAMSHALKLGKGCVYLNHFLKSPEGL